MSKHEDYYYDYATVTWFGYHIEPHKAVISR